MLPKSTRIYLSFHPDQEEHVQAIQAQVKLAGWKSIDFSVKDGGGALPDGALPDAASSKSPEVIEQSDLVLVLLSKSYVRNDFLMLEEFANAAVVMRKPFIPVWLDSLEAIQEDYDKLQGDEQILSTLEMLTAKHQGAAPEELVATLEHFELERPFYTPSTPQICEKPCEAHEGDGPFLFISYAHDDAKRVYPIIKELYESGWDLWYDEGIKTTERYMPVIASHVKRSAVFVLMLTNRCLERPFVMNYELEYAKLLGIPILVLRLEEICPPSWAEQTVKSLLGSAFTQEALHKRIEALGALPNRGIRQAVAPALRQNVVYDVVLPPKVPDFSIVSVQGNTITLAGYTGNKSKVVIPKTVSIPGSDMSFTVSAIGTEAFMGCTSLVEVTIPNSVTRIDDKAFRECSSLAQIVIPQSVDSIGDLALSSCRSLASVELPAKMSRIGGSAFLGCASLTSITLPEGITVIKDLLFFLCKSLVSVSIPQTVQSIEGMAFSGCSSLTHIDLPDGLTYIGKSAFSSCNSLTEVALPRNLKRIEDTAFDNTTRLYTKARPALKKKQARARKQLKKKVDKSSMLNVEIPQCNELPRALICSARADLQSIQTLLVELYWQGFNIYHNESPSQAEVEESECVLAFFTDNTKQSEPAIKLLQQAINRDPARIIQVFWGNCSTWPEAVREKLHDRQAIIQSQCTEREFEGKIRNGLRHFGCSLGHPRGFEAKSMGDGAEVVKFNETGLSQVIIPRTFFDPPLPVKSLGDASFKAKGAMRSVVIPNGVTHIGESAFANCKALTDALIPQSVLSIGESAFSGCTSLTGITLPQDMTRIELRTFMLCTSLTSVVVPQGVTYIGENAFANCESLASVSLPKSITTIQTHAFQGCKALKDISIPEGITCIQNFAFYGCSSLTSIEIPPGVTRICTEAFSECHALKSIVIPPSVEEISRSAFWGSKKLTIYTQNGSFAQGYAWKNKIRVKMMKSFKR
ncbi:MAG: leucine-rich repeat protein [Coriobacteriia bacterium]|nr:leucine-rich repeat protein [Coriobacteriia bacterium]